MLFTGTFEIPYFIVPIKEHLEIKEKLLEIIEKDEGQRRTDFDQTIYKTDYFLKKENREYFNILSPFITEILKDLPINCSFIDHDNHIWYQQYIKLDHHSFHIHNNQWSGIYYVELDKKSPGTQFKNYVSNTPIFPSIKEGDVLIFPGWLEHRSPPNISQKRKTVIAFNFSQNGEKINETGPM
jgi:hypothetical protein